ncbi:hypothetical protein HaLaN_11090, partial [Haematococcus lacustris]
MANLSGRVHIGYQQASHFGDAAVEEWAERTGAQMPGELTAPRNTLRGHPQPWRTRPSTALTDSGPLHQSVYGGSIMPGSKGHATPAAFVHGGPGQGHLTQGGSCSSTAETARADWERRMAAAGSGGLRGSLTPHWHPLEQADVTGTGSVATAQWSPGTTAYHVAGSTTMRKYLEEHQQPKAKSTWSTAADDRDEWEVRLHAQ